MSATKAEYIDALEAEMEAVWIRKFISRLGWKALDDGDDVIDKLSLDLRVGSIGLIRRIQGWQALDDGDDVIDKLSLDL
nr:hypothetical protein [Tanacetum cinerariifolium]